MYSLSWLTLKASGRFIDSMGDSFRVKWGQRGRRLGGSQIGATALWQIAQEMRLGSEYHQTVVFKNRQNATKTGVFAGFGITENRARATVVQYDEGIGRNDRRILRDNITGSFSGWPETPFPV